MRGQCGDTRTETWSLRGKCTPKERNPIAEFVFSHRASLSPRSVLSTIVQEYFSPTDACFASHHHGCRSFLCQRIVRAALRRWRRAARAVRRDAVRMGPRRRMPVDHDRVRMPAVQGGPRDIRAAALPRGSCGRDDHRVWPTPARDAYDCGRATHALHAVAAHLGAAALALGGDAGDPVRVDTAVRACDARLDDGGARAAADRLGRMRAARMRVPHDVLRGDAARVGSTPPRQLLVECVGAQLDLRACASVGEGRSTSWATSST